MYYVIGARSSGKNHKIIVLRNHSMAVIVATIWLFVYKKKQQQILESQVCLNDAVAKSWRCFGFSLQPVSRHWKRLVNCALVQIFHPHMIILQLNTWRGKFLRLITQFGRQILLNGANKNIQWISCVLSEQSTQIAITPFHSLKDDSFLQIR